MKYLTPLLFVLLTACGSEWEPTIVPDFAENTQMKSAIPLVNESGEYTDQFLYMQNDHLYIVTREYHSWGTKHLINCEATVYEYQPTAIVVMYHGVFSGWETFNFTSKKDMIRMAGDQNVFHMLQKDM